MSRIELIETLESITERLQELVIIEQENGVLSSDEQDDVSVLVEWIEELSKVEVEDKMKDVIEIIKEMIEELRDQCEEYELESNYSEMQDKIDTLYEVIKRLEGGK
jgi:hypothetical protein